MCAARKGKQGGKFGVAGLYEKRGTFYYRPTQVNRVRPPAICLHTSSLSEAVQAVATYQRQQAMAMDVASVYLCDPADDVVHGVSPKERVALLGNSVLRMGHLIKNYLRYKVQHREFTAKSEQAARLILGYVCSFWNDPPIVAVRRESVDSWRKHLLTHERKTGEGLARGYSEATVSSYLLRLRGFLTWCVERKHLRDHPMKGLRLGRVKATRLQQFVTIAERDRILALPGDDDVMTIFWLGFYAGMRFGEMLALRWMDLVVAGDGQVLLQIVAHDWFVPKGKRGRSVPVPRVLGDYLSALRRAGAADSDYVIAPRSKWEKKHAKGYRYNPKKSFATHAKSAGISWKMTYHHLRHSYVTHHMSRGTSLALIAQWTGDTESVLISNYAGFYPSHESVNAIE